MYKVELGFDVVLGLKEVTRVFEMFGLHEVPGMEKEKGITITMEVEDVPVSLEVVEAFKEVIKASINEDSAVKMELQGIEYRGCTVLEKIS